MQQAHVILREAVDSGQVAGVVALAANASGVVFQSAYGALALGAPAPMTLDSIFWIASLTKAVTSAAAMQLVERRAIGLHEPVGKILPELQDRQVLEGFDPGGTPKLRPARGDITLHHLLTHTAGLGYDFWNASLAEYVRATKAPPTQSGDPEGLRRPLLFDPGTGWNYGTNIDAVGLIVERLSGQSLGDYLRTEIFAPLGMADTGFGVDAARRDRLVGRHARQADGSLERLPPTAPEKPAFEAGGGGLYSTGPDYMRFLRMVLAGGTLDGQRILRPETIALMSRNQIGELDVSALPESVVPGMSNVANLLPGVAQKWGYGFLINADAVPGRRAAGSLAWAGLANLYYWIDPTHDMAGLIMTQVLPFADSIVLDVLARFEAAVYAEAGRNGPAARPPSPAGTAAVM